MDSKKLDEISKLMSMFGFKFFHDNEVDDEEWSWYVIQFPSGAQRNIFSGSLGLDLEDGSISTGWDFKIDIEYYVPSEHPKEKTLTKKDLISLADFQIECWKRYKNNLAD